MPTTTAQSVKPNNATADDHSVIVKLQKRLQTNAELPITNPSLGHKIQQLTKKQAQLTMSSLLSVCTKCKRKFKDKRSPTQHRRKLTTCSSQNAPSVNVNLANNEELLSPHLLTKHRQALAASKNPPSKANLVCQEPQSDKTGA